MTTTIEYTCLGCGKEGVASYCPACYEWGDFPALDTPNPAPPDPDPPDPLPPLPNMGTNPDEDSPPIGPDPERCPTCNNSGTTCLSCGAIDMAALGCHMVYLQHYDRPRLIQSLRDTPPRFWPLLAHAYVLALGATEAGQRVPAVGVVRLWQSLLAA